MELPAVPPLRLFLRFSAPVHTYGRGAHVAFTCLAPYGPSTVLDLAAAHALRYPE